MDPNQSHCQRLVLASSIPSVPCFHGLSQTNKHTYEFFKNAEWFWWGHRNTRSKHSMFLHRKRCPVMRLDTVVVNRRFALTVGSTIYHSSWRTGRHSFTLQHLPTNKLPTNNSLQLLLSTTRPHQIPTNLKKNLLKPLARIRSPSTVARSPTR